MADGEPVRIGRVVRYGGHRLYDGASGRYVSVEELRRRAAQGQAVSVVEAGTGADITAAVLA